MHKILGTKQAYNEMKKLKFKGADGFKFTNFTVDLGFGNLWFSVGVTNNTETQENEVCFFLNDCTCNSFSFTEREVKEGLTFQKFMKKIDESLDRYYNDDDQDWYHREY